MNSAPLYPELSKVTLLGLGGGTSHKPSPSVESLSKELENAWRATTCPGQSIFSFLEKIYKIVCQQDCMTLVEIANMLHDCRIDPLEDGTRVNLYHILNEMIMRPDYFSLYGVYSNNNSFVQSLSITCDPLLSDLDSLNTGSCKRVKNLATDRRGQDKQDEKIKEWTHALRDIQGLDKFHTYRPDGSLLVTKTIMNRCHSIVICSPSMMSNVWQNLKRRLKEGQVVSIDRLRENGVGFQASILLLGRLRSISNRASDGDCKVSLVQGMSEPLLVRIPKTIITDCIRILSEKTNRPRGLCYFNVLVKMLCDEYRLLHCEAIELYLMTFDWSQANVRVFGINEKVSHFHLEQEDQPNERRYIRHLIEMLGRHGKKKDVVLGLRFGCSVRPCNDRFPEEKLVVRHILEDHGLSEKQMNDARSLDTCNTSEFYNFTDEYSWLQRNGSLTQRLRCLELNGLGDRCKSFVKIHTQNKTKFKNLQMEIGRLAMCAGESTDNDLRYMMMRTLEKLNRHLKIGKERVIPDKNFNQMFEMWLTVLKQRADENNAIADYQREIEESVTSSQPWKAINLADADFQSSLERCGGTDFSIAADKVLGVNMRGDDLQQGSLRNAILTNRLCKRKSASASACSSSVKPYIDFDEDANKQIFRRLERIDNVVMPHPEILTSSPTRQDSDDDDDDSDSNSRRKPEYNEYEKRIVKVDSAYNVVTHEDEDDYSSDRKTQGLTFYDRRKQNQHDLSLTLLDPMERKLATLSQYGQRESELLKGKKTDVIPKADGTKLDKRKIKLSFDEDKSQLVLLDARDIKMHRMDCFDQFCDIIKDIIEYSKDPSMKAAFSVKRDMVNMFTAIFHLSKSGTNFLRDSIQNEVLKKYLENPRRFAELWTEYLEKYFKLLNSNSNGEMNRLFKKRYYRRDDPYKCIVKYDDGDDDDDDDGGGGGGDDDYGNVSLESFEDVTRDERTHRPRSWEEENCSLCLEPLGPCRELQAINCKELKIRRLLGQGASDNELIRYSEGNGSTIQEWNGCHLFHESCLQEFLRVNAMDESIQNVSCPVCKTPMYDRYQLDVIQFKLCTDKKVSQSTFDTKQLPQMKTSLTKVRIDSDKTMDEFKSKVRDTLERPPLKYKASAKDSNHKYTIDDTREYIPQHVDQSRVDQLVNKLCEKKFVECNKGLFRENKEMALKPTLRLKYVDEENDKTYVDDEHRVGRSFIQWEAPIF